MESDSTSERIAEAAMERFIRHGVRKTNLEEVAFDAGVTRVTVYRYFGDKKGLVRAICQRIAGLFRAAARQEPGDSVQVIGERLNELGTALRRLPDGNFLASLDEIRRTYPDVYAEYRAEREQAVDCVFHYMLDTARRETLVREGLNVDVLKAIFMASVVGLLENRALISSNVPLAEVFHTVTEVFRRGILKPREGDDP